MQWLTQTHNSCTRVFATLDQRKGIEKNQDKEQNIGCCKYRVQALGTFTGTRHRLRRRHQGGRWQVAEECKQVIVLAHSLSARGVYIVARNCLRFLSSSAHMSLHTVPQMPSSSKVHTTGCAQFTPGPGIKPRIHTIGCFYICTNIKINEDHRKIRFKKKNYSCKIFFKSLW